MRIRALFADFDGTLLCIGAANEDTIYEVWQEVRDSADRAYAITEQGWELREVVLDVDDDSLWPLFDTPTVSAEVA